MPWARAGRGRLWQVVEEAASVQEVYRRYECWYTAKSAEESDGIVREMAGCSSEKCKEAAVSMQKRAD